MNLLFQATKQYLTLVEDCEEEEHMEEIDRLFSALDKDSSSSSSSSSSSKKKKKNKKSSKDDFIETSPFGQIKVFYNHCTHMTSLCTFSW